jgi:hypothetical protein
MPLKASKTLLDNFASDQDFMTCPVCKATSGYYTYVDSNRHPALSQRARCPHCSTCFYWNEPDQPGGMKVKVVYPDGR